MKIKFGGVVQFYGGAGFLPNRSLSAFTTGLDWHFPIKSSENKTRKFYLNNGIAFFPSGSSFSAEDDKMVIWYSRTGFSIYNSTKTDMSGFDFDVGLFVETGYKGFSYGPHVITGTRQVIKDKRLIGPAASLSYFFKL